MSYSDGEQVAGAMHGILGGIGNAVATGLIASRNAQADRRTAQARCVAAANRARAGVLQSTAAGLREQVADLRAENGVLRDELADRDEQLAQLRRDLAAVCALVRDIRAGRAA